MLSVDLVANEQADANIVLAQTDNWEQQGVEVGCLAVMQSAAIEPRCMLKQADSKVDTALNEDKLDAIICVAGGWAGGNAASAGNCYHR